MRTLLALSLIACSAAAHAEGMKAVPDRERGCFGKATYCYEWALASDPAIRFLAVGDEDDIEYSFERKTGKGTYRYLVRIQPVLKDASRTKSLYWAYPWDMQDIALDPSGAILATFEHRLMDDYNGVTPLKPGQKRVPAVLFLGRTTQPDIKVPALRFDRSSIASLQRDAAGADARPRKSAASTAND